jgi:hypothetical protein
MSAWGDLDVAARRLVYGATGGQEPTTIAYDELRGENHPLRDRFVFCGRITDHGHADDCPWLAVMDLLCPKPNRHLRRVRPGLYERIKEPINLPAEESE